MKRSLFFFIILSLFGIPANAWADKVSLLVIDADSYLLNKAVTELELPGGLEIRLFTLADLSDDKGAQKFVAGSKVIMVDVMLSELSDYLIKSVDLGSRRVYALRGSRDDQRLRDKGFIFDPQIEEYYNNLSKKNIQSLIYRVIHQEIDPSVSYQEVEPLSKLGVYHPGAKKTFDNSDAYIKWYKGKTRYTRGAPWIGLMLFKTSLIEGQVETKVAA